MHGTKVQMDANKNKHNFSNISCVILASTLLHPFKILTLAWFPLEAFLVGKQGAQLLLHEKERPSELTKTILTLLYIKSETNMKTTIKAAF